MMEEDNKKKKKNKKKNKNKQATKPTEIVSSESGQSHVPDNSISQAPGDKYLSTDVGGHVDVNSGGNHANGTKGKNVAEVEKQHWLDIEHNSISQVPGDIYFSTDVGGHVDVNSSGNHANGSKGKNVAEAEKQHWLDREANLQDKVRALEAEKDAHIQKENILEIKIKHLLTENAEYTQKEDIERQKLKTLQDEKSASIHKENLLEERIKQLLKEKDENVQREASEREKIKTIYDEKNACMQNEVSLKEKLMQLEKENNALRLSEGMLEQKILQLQKEIEVRLQKEAHLDVKILNLEGEKGSWVQKEVNLQEKIEHMEKERDSWNLKENSANDSVACLSNENTKLRAQVIELEHSREILLVEKEQLTQALSGLQLQLDNLKTAAGTRHSSVDNKVISEDGDANYQIEAERALIGKLVAENSELVEKVNELCAELDRRGVRTEEYLSVPNDVTTNQSSENTALLPDGVDGGHIIGQVTDSIFELPISGSTHFPEDVIAEDQTNSSELGKINDVSGLANSSEIEADDEIVQIPLDESEIKENSTVLPPQNDDDVFITDAPLIGAPFRLISFVARYVSGADLVSKNSG